jgi:hypothetical protein
MRFYLKQEYGSSVSQTIAGKRVWASGSNVFEVLADCERAFWRYKKRKEKQMRAVPSWDGFEVESATFIPTGLAGQGAAYNRVPCVQVTLQPDGTYKAKLAHLDPLTGGRHLVDFMKRLGLRWRPVVRYMDQGSLEPVSALLFFDWRAFEWGVFPAAVHRTNLPYQVSMDTLKHRIGEDQCIALGPVIENDSGIFTD